VVEFVLGTYRGSIAPEVCRSAFEIAAWKQIRHLFRRGHQTFHEIRNKSLATKHINAAPGDFAETVLMPGDPLRAQYIADTYIDGARRVTDVRNMWGFTGEYKGKPVSVMAHGMGIPSVSIYCTELITEYEVKRVIRVGSCGTTHPRVKLRDIIIAMGASTDSAVNRIRF
jgi:purine-nucleoside phosphorylase